MNAPLHLTCLLGIALVASPVTAQTADTGLTTIEPTMAETAEASPEGPFRAAPVVLPAPRDLGVGHMVPDVEVRDLDGVTGRLSEACDGNALVIVMRDVGCPVSRRFGPRLARLEEEFADRNVRFLYLDVNEDDDAQELRASNDGFGLKGRAVLGAEAPLARVLQPTTTTEAFVLDAARTLRYRGAVDDQYGIGYSLAEPRRTYLVDALLAVVGGSEVAVKGTTAPGCALELSTPQTTRTAPTYHGAVSRLVQDNCLACHRQGGVGPFALDSYESVQSRKGMVRFVTEKDIMPPWHAVGGGPWTNDRSLSGADLETLHAWLDADCPEGDPADAPLPRSWSDDWLIGTPDLVIENPETFSVPAEGVVDYRYTYVKTTFEEDKWIRAVEIRPGATQVVHHSLVFLEGPREPGESDAAFNRRFQGGLFGYFAAYVPGQGPVVYPEGFAKKLPAGSWLKFQMHYTPNGESVLDTTRLGFVFADEPPETEVFTSAVSKTDLYIEPEDGSQKVRAGIKFDRPSTLAAFSPHMHLRGKAFRYELYYPDETRRVVLDVPRYDFNWQTLYQLAEPLTVPAGTMLVCTAWYDNSADNPANPDPTAAVVFGEQTWDEMMIGYFEWWPEQDDDS